MIFDVDTSVSLPDAFKFFDMAVNVGHDGRHTRAVKKLAKKLGKRSEYRNHFQTGTIGGFSILNHVAKRGSVLLAKLLMAELLVDPNLPDETKRITLHYAMKSGNVELVTELLNRYNSDANARDICGSTPFHLAIYHGNTEVARLLLESGANVQMENHCGRPMHAAALMGNFSALTTIAHSNPLEVTVKVSGLVSPLVSALYGKEPECETLLIQYCPLDGMVLFHKIISFKDTQEEALWLVNILLSRGADPNICDQLLYEDLPVICAAKKGWSTVVTALLPTTRRIPDVDDWSSAGLINYVNSDPFKMMDADRVRTRVANLKPRILEELSASNALTAFSICMSLKGDMDPQEFAHLTSLCRFMIFMWFEGYPVTCNPADMVGWVASLSAAQDPKIRDWAVIGIEGCLALSPNNLEYTEMYNKLTGRDNVAQ